MELSRKTKTLQRLNGQDEDEGEDEVRIFFYHFYFSVQFCLNVTNIIILNATKN